jgi:hypothetical protein
MMELEFSRLHHLTCRIRDLLLNSEKWEWAAWMDRSTVLIERGAPNGIERFLAAFGGIDGIDREVTAPVNRLHVSNNALNDVNRVLAKLLGRVHTTGVCV